MKRSNCPCRRARFPRFCAAARSSPARGFVLHQTISISTIQTLPIDGGVSLTATVDILRAIADGSGPDRAILALGYAGWSPGQLEDEMQNNGWLTCPADASLIFDTPLEERYGMAMRKIGIDPGFLSADAGHA